METNTKRCPGCLQEKPIEEFAKKTGGKLHSRCRECNRVYGRVHYAANRQKYIDKSARNRQRIVERIQQIKATTPCADCGKQYPPYVMDFDHLRDKDIGIFLAPRMVSSWRKILLEIEKCEIVCANCHRIRTHQRRIARGQPTEFEDMLS